MLFANSNHKFKQGIKNYQNELKLHVDKFHGIHKESHDIWKMMNLNLLTSLVGGKHPGGKKVTLLPDEMSTLTGHPALKVNCTPIRLQCLNCTMEFGLVIISSD